MSNPGIECYVIEIIEPRQYVEQYPGIRSPLYRRIDNGDIKTLSDFPPGAMVRNHGYESTMLPEIIGVDGQSWSVKMPSSPEESPLMWHIDGQASNCTKKDDKIHKCWCRHGVAPRFTVDKNGNTCSAGAGSILVPGWHGFLRDGYLIP